MIWCTVTGERRWSSSCPMAIERRSIRT
jgi:hypothetical protein